MKAKKKKRGGVMGLVVALAPEGQHPWILTQVEKELLSLATPLKSLLWPTAQEVRKLSVCRS